MGKIQVNPSTGKVLVIRDSSGISKLCSTCCNTIPSVCAVCSGTQPATLNLNLSNFVDANPAICTTATLFSGANRWAHFPIGTAALLNGSHILPHISGCIYQKTIAVSYTPDLFSDNICTIDVSDRVLAFLHLRALGQLFNVGVNIWYQVNLSAAQEAVFTGNIFYVGDEVCFDVANTVNNTWDRGPCKTDGIGGAVATGTAGISL